MKLKLRSSPLSWKDKINITFNLLNIKCILFPVILLLIFIYFITLVLLRGANIVFSTKKTRNSCVFFRKKSRSVCFPRSMSMFCSVALCFHKDWTLRKSDVELRDVLQRAVYSQIIDRSRLWFFFYENTQTSKHLSAESQRSLQTVRCNLLCTARPNKRKKKKYLGTRRSACLENGFFNFLWQTKKRLTL